MLSLSNIVSAGSSAHRSVVAASYLGTSLNVDLDPLVSRFVYLLGAYLGQIARGIVGVELIGALLALRFLPFAGQIPRGWRLLGRRHPL
jgi:hypothetical protein